MKERSDLGQKGARKECVPLPWVQSCAGTDQSCLSALGVLLSLLWHSEAEKQNPFVRSPQENAYRGRKESESFERSDKEIIPLLPAGQRSPSELHSSSSGSHFLLPFRDIHVGVSKCLWRRPRGLGCPSLQKECWDENPYLLILLYAGDFWVVLKKKEGWLVIFFLQLRRNSSLILFFSAVGFDVSGLKCCLSSQLAAVGPFQDTTANESQPAAVGRMEGGNLGCPWYLPISSAGHSPIFLSFYVSFVWTLYFVNPHMQCRSKIGLQKENLGFPGTGVTPVWKGYPGTTKPLVNNLCAV